VVEAQAVLDEAKALDWSPLVVYAGLTVSNTQSRLANYEEAKRAGEQAFWTAAASGDELGMLMSATELGTVFENLALHEEAHGWVSLAKALVERLDLIGTAHEAQMLDRLATINRSTGQYQDAVTHQTRALQVYEEVLGPKHPVVAIALMNLGNSYGEIGQHQTALDCYYRALELLEAAVGPQHEYVGHIANNIGVELANIGDLAGALTYYQRALAVWEMAYGPDHPQVAQGLDNVGLMLESRGDVTEALALYRRALGIYEAALPPEHPSIGRTHQYIGSALRAGGSFTEALEHQQRAMSILEAALGPAHPDVLVVRLDIGGVLREQGHIEQALAELGSAVEQLDPSGGDSYAYAHGLLEYGIALLEHGDVAAAREQLERAVSIQERDRVGVQLAEAHFELAQAVWAGGEESRARALAEAARMEFISSDRFGARGLAEVEAWLREHT
jgi:tetratricopeptide (TPR) repeat protein